MHRYQVWVTFAILLALAPLSGLYSIQAQSTDNDTRHTYSEDFSTLSKLDYLENTHLDAEKKQLTLQLDDHIVQQEPVVVGDPADAENVYVVWHDLRNDTGDIYAQKLDANGMRRWPDDKLVNNSPEGTTQSKPAAVVDSAGNLWVVWVDNRNGNNDIYAQGLANEDSNWIWSQGDQLVNQEGSGANQGDPAVAVHKETLTVVWHDNRDDNDFDIYAGKSGLTDGSRFEPIYNGSSLNIDANGPQTSPTIAVDSSGNAIVAWLDQRIGNGDIYAQQISADGRLPWGEERRINQPEHGAQKPPALVMKSDGEAIVCWLSSADTGNQVYMRAINDGQPTGTDISITGGLSANFGVQPAATLVGDQIAIGWKQINDGNLHINIRGLSTLQTSGATGKIDGENQDGSSNRSQMLSLGALNSSEFFAVWVDSRQGRKTDIYAQKFKLDGTSVWSQARFINKSTGQIDQQNPAVVIDSQQNSIVAWSSERGGQSNLFLQKFDSNGEPLWPQQIPVSNFLIQGESLIPDLAVFDNDILITWSDKRTGKSRVYIQRFDSDGNRVWDSDRTVSEPENPSTVEQFNPKIVAGEFILNPLNGSTVPAFFVVWQENSGTTSYIVLQRFEGEGLQPWSSNVRIESNEGSLRSPTLALTNSQIAIVWTSTVGNDTDLYLQIYNNEGGTSRERIQVNQFNGLVDQINAPVLAADKGGNLTVVWVDRRESAIYASRYTSNADPDWLAKKLNQVPGSFSPTPGIAAVPGENNTIIVWQGMNQGELSVYAQLLNEGGESAWPLTDTTDAEMAAMVSKHSQNAWLPAVAVDSGGMSTIVWREERNMNQDIYLQRLNINGEPVLTKDVDVDVAVIGTDKFYRSDGLVQSGSVDDIAEPIQKALLTYQGTLNSGQITFSLTKNGGQSWDQVQAGVIHTFTDEGSDLRWQAHLQQPNVASLGQSPPVINSLQISYSSIISSAGDVYEPDDGCSNTWSIQPDGVVQKRMLHPAQNSPATTEDEDWISFQAEGGKKYALLAVPTDGSSTLQMEIFRGCSDSVAIDKQRGSPDDPAYLVRQFETNRYYVKISPAFSIKVSIPYQFSIRPVPSTGMAIIVAGAHDSDSLKDKVDESAGRVERMLPQNGFTIAYSNSQNPGVTLKSLQEAFQAQSREIDTPLIIYLVGQLEVDNSFRLSENELLTSDMLNLWLSNLENLGRTGPVIVVIETDRAASFIEKLSGPNRVIVTSTNESTPRGFLFSDAFWLAMRQGYNVQQSFEIGRGIVDDIGVLCLTSAGNCPRIDDSLNQTYRNGLNVSSNQVPVVQYIDVKRINFEPASTITARISNTNSTMLLELEAHIRALTTNATNSGLVDGSPITLTLELGSSDLYSGKLEPKPADGNYRITIYGWGNNFALLPEFRDYYFQLIYFPFISR